MTDWELVKNITGYASTALLASLYIPQTWLVYRNKDPSGLSKVFLLLGIALTIDTTVYAAILEELPLIIANAIAFICIVLMLVAKYIWPDSNKQLPSELVAGV